MMDYREELIIDALQAQIQYLEAVSQRHLRWAKVRRDEVEKNKHIAIAHSLQNVSEELYSLLEDYRNSHHL